MADIKNFGLKGVGTTVQYGKNGPRITNAGGRFEALSADGGTLVSLRGAQGTHDDDFVTVAQLAAASSGINVKEAVSVVAQTADLSGTTWVGESNPANWSATPTAAQVGTFTNVPAVINGHTLQIGDRVLVRHESVTYGGESGAVAVSGAQKNGIYVCTTAGAGGVLVRAGDHGGSLVAAANGAAAYERNNDDLRYGDYVFVSGGTVGGSASYIVTNTPGTIEPDPSFEPDLNEDDATGWVIFLQFSATPTYTADSGVKKVGGNFSLDVDSLGDATATLTSTLPMGDGVGGGTDTKATIQSVLNQLDIPYSIGTNGILVRDAADSYSSRTITGATTTPAKNGITVTNGDGVGGNMEIELDLHGLTAATSQGTDTLTISNATTNSKVSITDFLTQHNIASGISGDGYLFNHAGTTRSGTFSAAGAGNLQGASVTTTSATGNTVFGVNIAGAVTGTAAVTDELLVHKTGGTADNRKVTVQSIVDLALGSVSTNKIEQDDTSMVIADTGVGGTITITVDNNVIGIWDANGFQADSIGADDLDATQVVLGGGIGGKLNSSSSLTYNGSLLGVTGGVTASGQLAGGTISVTTGGTISGTLNYGSLNGGAIVSNGAIGTTATISAGGAGTFGSVIDQSLTTVNGVVFATGGNLTQEAGFEYDATTNTLTVENLNVSGTGSMAIGATEVAFGKTGGNGVVGDAQFTYNGTTDTLTVGNGTLIGDSTGHTTLGTSKTNGNIVLAPNGAGDVIISGTGGAELSADTGQSLTLRGDGITLTSVDGTTTFAEFSAGSGSANYVAIDSSGTGVAPSIITEGTDTNINLEIGGKGTGTVIVTSATYETDMVADSLATKQYVDSAISTAVVPGAIASMKAVLDAQVGTAQAIGTIPAAATIMSIRFNVTGAADNGAECTFDGLSQIANATETDPTVAGIYVVDMDYHATLGEAITCTFTTTSTTASAPEAIITYRYN